MATKKLTKNKAISMCYYSLMMADGELDEIEVAYVVESPIAKRYKVFENGDWWWKIVEKGETGEYIDMLPTPAMRKISKKERKEIGLDLMGVAAINGKVTDKEVDVHMAIYKGLGGDLEEYMELTQGDFTIKNRKKTSKVKRKSSSSGSSSRKKTSKVKRKSSSSGSSTYSNTYTEDLGKVMSESARKKTSSSSRSSSSSGGCFVATATMGNYNHPIVLDLRIFRDESLRKSITGRIFIYIYYKIGPFFANIIKESRTLRNLSFKFLIKPLHSLITKK